VPGVEARLMVRKRRSWMFGLLTLQSPLFAPEIALPSVSRAFVIDCRLHRRRRLATARRPDHGKRRMA
jgi:hypothetical protein